MYEDLINFTEIYVLHFIVLKPFQNKNVDLMTSFGLCEKIYLETMYKALEKILINKNYIKGYLNFCKNIDNLILL